MENAVEVIRQRLARELTVGEKSVPYQVPVYLNTPPKRIEVYSHSYIIGPNPHPFDISFCIVTFVVDYLHIDRISSSQRRSKVGSTSVIIGSRLISHECGNLILEDRWEICVDRSEGTGRDQIRADGARDSRVV